MKVRRKTPVMCGITRPGQANGEKRCPCGSTDGRGRFDLVPESPGYDAGLRLANFNDGYTGQGPDIGAHEAGTPAIEFGVDAYRTEE